jgi:hypothetical protein
MNLISFHFSLSYICSKALIGSLMYVWLGCLIQLYFSSLMTYPLSLMQRSKACEGRKFKELEDSIILHDYQEIKLQENTQVLGVGAIPRSIPVILKDDLVDVVKAGGTNFCEAFFFFSPKLLPLLAIPISSCIFKGTSTKMRPVLVFINSDLDKKQYASLLSLNKQLKLESCIQPVLLME